MKNQGRGDSGDGEPGPRVVKGDQNFTLSTETFRARFRERFYDPAFDAVRDPLERVMNFAWETYRAYRKSPRTSKAGPGFAESGYELPVEWLETRREIAAHGVLIACPVNWYQAPSVLKLMIDRLVCADGGNPDPTSTHGKDPARAKTLELQGWPYPKHLAGRAFAVVVHGDAAGAENLRRILVDWLTDLELIPAGPSAGLGRYVGYYQPYATSHDDLDKDVDLQAEVRNLSLSLVETVRQIRTGQYRRPDANLEEPRKK